MNLMKLKHKVTMVEGAAILFTLGFFYHQFLLLVYASEKTETVAESVEESLSEGAEIKMVEPPTIIINNGDMAKLEDTENVLVINTVVSDDFVESVTEGQQNIQEMGALVSAKNREQLGLVVNVSDVTVEVSEDNLVVLTEEEVSVADTYTKVDALTITNIDDVPVMTGYMMGDGKLSEKYAYTLYDTAGRRNDMNEYLLSVLEESCEMNGVPSHLLAGMLMTESEGHTNARSSKSTATGLCQFLSGTGKYVWEDLMGNGKGTYNHDMAYNPEINIRMGAAYLGYLIRTKGDIYSAIRTYRGKNDISGYVSVINSHIGKVGLSVDTINNMQ